MDYLIRNPNQDDVKLVMEKLSLKEILRQSAEAVAHLHDLGFIHRNLHPKNFLIAQNNQGGYAVKLSDFHCTKDWLDDPEDSNTQASYGWGAPENIQYEERAAKSRQHPSSSGPLLDYRTDVFIMACYFYFVLSGGLHPFGDNIDKRRSAIKCDSSNNEEDPANNVYHPEWQGTWKNRSTKKEITINSKGKTVKPGEICAPLLENLDKVSIYIFKTPAK